MLLSLLKKKRVYRLYIPLISSVEYSLHLTKISILKYEGSIKKISYECRAYESVDVRSLF